MEQSGTTTATVRNTMNISSSRKRPARAMLVSAAAALASFSGEHGVFVSAQDATQDAPENNNIEQIRTAPGSGSSGGINDEGQKPSSLAEALALYDLSRLDDEGDLSSGEGDYPSCDALTDVFGAGAACPSDDTVPCSGIEVVTEHCRTVLLSVDNDDEDVDPAALEGCVAYVGWHDGGLACCPSTSCFDAFHDQMGGEDDKEEEEEDGYYYDEDEEDDEDDDDEEEKDGWEYIALSPHEPVPEVGTLYFDDAEDEPTSTSSDSPESSPNDAVDSADFDTANHGNKDASTSGTSGDTYQFDPIADADELRIFLRIMAADLTPAEIDEVERRLYEHYYPDGEEDDYDYGYEDEEEDYEDDTGEDDTQASNVDDDTTASGSNSSNNNNNNLVNETHDADHPTTTDASAATKNFSTDEAVVDISRRAGQQRTDQ